MFLFNLILRTCLLILERGKGRERERERNTNLREKHLSIASHMHPTRDHPHNPGICPGQEPNPDILFHGTRLLPIETHQPGLKLSSSRISRPLNRERTVSPTNDAEKSRYPNVNI